MRLCNILIIMMLAIWGGVAFAGNITISSSHSADDVHGNGTGADGEPTYNDETTTGNTVTIGSGGIVDDKSVYGGYAEVSSGGNSASSRSNTVTLENGGKTTTSSTGGNVYGGYAYNSDTGSATASRNTVYVKVGSEVGYNLYGGYTETDSGAATASDNTVEITGTAKGLVYGGYAYSSSGTATASDNIVKISSGRVEGTRVYGGYAQNTAAAAATASGNTIEISGTTTLANSARIYGGYVETSGGVGTATNNTVTIAGTLTGTGFQIYGGQAGGSPSTKDVFTGNTLNLKTAGLSVHTIANFEKLNFYLPASVVDGGTVLTVSTQASLTSNGTPGGTSSTINVGIDGGSSTLQVGNTVTLIDVTAASGLIVNGLDGTELSAMAGVTLQYEFKLLVNNDKLIAEVTKAPSSAPTPTPTPTPTPKPPAPTVRNPVNPRVKALSEGFIAGAAFASQGGNLIATEAMSQAVGSAHTAAGSGFGSFGAFSGGTTRYDSGSHVDVSSFSLAAGLAWGREVTPGRFTFGAFFEYGNGSYDTYNSFSTAASVHGDGNLDAVGGGILGRLDFTDAGFGTFFLEASARLGKLDNDYGTSDLLDSRGRAAGYSSSSTYGSLHLGLGHRFTLSERAMLELSGKYFWTRQQGDSVTLTTGDPVTFDDADSHRVRVGVRYAYALSEAVSPYAGIAYEHEFDGEAGASTRGYRIESPSLRGGTGMAEMGVSLTPSQNIPLSVDLGLQGYVGKRQGVLGNLKVGLAF